MLGTLLIFILVLLLIGVLPAGPTAYIGGITPVVGLGLFLLVILNLVLLGYI